MRSIKHINVYQNLHGKKIEREAAVCFLDYVQKDIQSGKITRSKDRFCSEISQIQSSLVKIVNALAPGEIANIEIDPARKKHYEGIVKSQGLGSLPVIIAGAISALTQHHIHKMFGHKATGLNGLKKKSVVSLKVPNDDLVLLLSKHAEKFRFVKYSYNNFINDFGVDFSVKTPLGNVIIDIEQFEKINDKDRTKYFGLIKPTLSNPTLIVKHRGSNLFIKSFIDTKRGEIYFVSVASNKNGELKIVSNHEKNLSSILNKLKEGSIRYQISSLGATTPLTPKRSAKLRQKYRTIFISLPSISKISNAKLIKKPKNTNNNTKSFKITELSGVLEGIEKISLNQAKSLGIITDGLGFVEKDIYKNINKQILTYLETL